MANPMPTFAWHKDNHLIESRFVNSTLETSVLQLGNVTAADGGNYSCTAMNVAGNATSEQAILTIKCN